MHRYETGHQLQSAGVISGFDSTVEADSNKAYAPKSNELAQRRTNPFNANSPCWRDNNIVISCVKSV